MPPHSTEAVVLHAFDYLESSRIIRMLTRDHGLRAVLARGARSSRKRFGNGLDLFAQGTAELDVKPGRDLDTLSSFDIIRTRGGIGNDLSRFTGASALAELLLRFAQNDTDEALFDAATDAFDSVALATGDRARDAAIAGAWRILGALGFAPSLEECGECQRPFTDVETVLFSQSAGGALCETCASLARVGRKLPGSARLALVQMTSTADSMAPFSDAEARAHQRLLREFVIEHLSDGKPLRAFDAWETGTMTSTVHA